MHLLSESQLQRLLADLYGDDGARLAPLDGEFDQNVRVDSATGRSALKVMHPGADEALVEMQVAALEHLARRAPGVPVPRVIPTRSGRGWEWVEVEGGERRLVWRLTWLEGRPLLEGDPRRALLLHDWGRVLGELNRALEPFVHPALERSLIWDPARAGWLADAVAEIEDLQRRALVARVVARWPELERRLQGLPQGVVHGDANDHNIVVEDTPDPRRIAGLFDFGDMMRTRRICEVAIAAAYAGFQTKDPIGAMAEVVAGFHEVRPLAEAELEVVMDLVRTRLAISVVVSGRRAQERPDETYLTVSEAAAWKTLALVDGVHPTLATARIRNACGLPPFATGPAVVEWLEATAAAGGFAPILGRPLSSTDLHLLDLSVGSLLLGADPAMLSTAPMSERVFGAMTRAGASVGIGRWDEARPIYLGPAFANGDHVIDEHRTIHLGIDLFVPAGAPLFAPLDGVVEALADNADPKDYGPVVLLRHEPEGVPRFWTLWGHLDPEVLDRLAPGQRVAKNDRLALVGAPPRNGDWPPHLHLQLVLDPMDRGHDVPGVAPARERSTWKAWFPDPSALYGLAPGAAATRAPSVASLRTRRAARLGTTLSLSYDDPIHAVRGWRQYLYDAQGRTYLDLYNNVPHVGHSHPSVVEAVQRQVALLNTNTRYLHETILDYGDALAARLPDALEVVWVVNSATEANELALRLARAYTGRKELVVQEAGYHGHTTTLIDASPYKFDGPGGEGAPEWVEVVPVPDDYRGRYRRGDGDPGARYGDEVRRRVEAMSAAGRPPGALLAETFPSVGGQIVPPDGYLPRAYAAIRAAGGVCIADEVQTGFGRLGDAFWGFELQGVVPDMVVLGKPAGNGMPLGVVVATREIADAFDTGMEFFSTFGGNPVSCAAGLAVLDVIEREGLQARAAETGGRLLAGLAALAERFPLLGDVRGRGLFIGVECVSDSGQRTPAPGAARYLVGRLRDEGILAGTDGPDHNVLKLRGPLVIDPLDVDRFLGVFEVLLAEPGARG